ncbi:DUF6221 family protein [Streptomyces glaucescens]|uniref:DUF6221 family protein n=1 Tax=Streptomyces glaucescens TaxID=1907 RepID=UPI000D1A73B4|nr:DUF6221 family protein [Streptomyces glaucescens]
MEDLVQFLHDRLDDDATFMQAAIRLRESGAIVSSPQATEGAFALMDIVQNDPDTVQALSVFTRTGARAPGEAERVLAEVDAKRDLLELHRQLEDSEEMLDFCATCDATGKYPEYPCRTLRLLALPYADHPDYNEAWRP